MTIAVAAAFPCRPDALAPGIPLPVPGRNTPPCEKSPISHTARPMLVSSGFWDRPIRGRPAVFWQASSIIGLLLERRSLRMQVSPINPASFPLSVAPFALPGRLPTAWVPSLFGSQRAREVKRHRGCSLQAFNMAVEPISLTLPLDSCISSFCE